MQKVKVGVFVPTAPMIVAQSNGIFADNGLDVSYHQVASSMEQFQDFSTGNYDLVQTAFDNVINYRLNHDNALRKSIPIKAYFALDGGMNLSLMTLPHIKTFSDLKGATLTVDAEDTGFAFVLYKFLELGGLVKNEDYQVVSHGGVTQRCHRISKGESSGTLLNGGLEIVAADKGLNCLRSSRDCLYPYLGSVIAVEESWLAAHGDIAARFRNSYDEALRYVLDTANSEDVAKDLAAARSISPSIAMANLKMELGDTGITRTTEIDRDAAMRVLELRVFNAGLGGEKDWDSDRLRALFPELIV